MASRSTLAPNKVNQESTLFSKWLLLLPMLLLCACQPIRPLEAARTELPPSPVGPTLNHDLAEVSLVDWVEDFAQESYTDEEMLQVGRTFTYTVPLHAKRPLFWTQQWCAKDEATLRQNVQVVNWSFSINDTPVANDQFLPTFAPLYGAYCYVLQTQVTDWPPDRVELKAVITIEQPLNNGYHDYPAGAQTFWAVVTQQPATTNRETTAVDCALRSRVGRKAVTLSFHNDSTRAVNAYWLDYEGKEVYYFRLQPRATYSQQTYVTHPWCIRDAETKEIVLAVTAEDQAATVEIR